MGRMRRPILAAPMLAAAVALWAATATLAHGGTGEASVTVEPAVVTAGSTVVLAGSGLEPGADRVIALVGDNLTVDFASVKTDAVGVFAARLTVPAHLPTGQYTLQAIGDETLTVPLTVTAAEGTAAEASAADAAADAVVARQRAPLELAAIIAAVVLLAIVGAVLVRQAERVHGPAPS